MLVRATLPADQLKRKLQDLVNEIRDERLSAPFVFHGVTYDTDEKSIANLTAMLSAVTAGIPLPEGFVWRSSDNLDIPHDVESLKALVGSLVGYRSAVYAKSFALKNAIAASDCPSQIDLLAGWPDVSQDAST